MKNSIKDSTLFGGLSGLRSFQNLTRYSIRSSVGGALSVCENECIASSQGLVHKPHFTVGASPKRFLPLLILPHSIEIQITNAYHGKRIRKHRIDFSHNMSGGQRSHFTRITKTNTVSCSWNGVYKSLFIECFKNNSGDTKQGEASCINYNALDILVEH